MHPPCGVLEPGYRQLGSLKPEEDFTYSTVQILGSISTMRAGQFLYRGNPTIWVLFVLTTVGALLRFYGLEIQSLWYDELATWRNSRGPSGADVWELMRANQHPPGHVILMFYWQMVFGSSESALRMPSAIAGVLSIPAIYLLGRELYSRSEGLIAATLLTVGWIPISYSQEARAYALLILLAIISTWLLLKIIRHLAGVRPLPLSESLAYALLSALACYLHYFGMVLVLFQASAFAVRHWNRPRGLLWGLVLFGPVLLLCFPWLIETLKDLKIQRFWAPPLKPVFWEFHKIVKCLLGGEVGALLGYALIGVLLIKSVWSRQMEPRTWYKAPTPFLIAWIVFPFALAYVKSLISAPIMVPRYFLISLPAANLLFAHALVGIIENNRYRIAIAASIAAGYLGHLLFGAEYFTSVSKEQFREAVAEVVTLQPEFPGAMLVGWHSGYFWRNREPMFNYYLGRLGSELSVSAQAGKQRDAIPFIRFIERHRPAYFWYIYAHKRPDPAFERALSTRFEVERSTELYKAGAILFRTGFSD